MKHLPFIAVAVAAGLLLSGCTKPVAKDEFVEINPNETAFLIAMDGNTKDGQAKLNSIEYLEQNKVQLKRIYIPHVLVNICPTAYLSCWQDLPKARLVRISRTPETREWTMSNATGTAAKNQAFHVETTESIDFDIGATLTAHIDEAQTAKFLYHYSGKQLAEVLDTNVRSYIASKLADAFGSQTLDYARAHKAEIFAKVGQETSAAFAARGITIDNFGYAEGMNYRDASIQAAINKKFAADMLKQTAQSQAEAAEKFAKAQDAIRAMENLDMQKKLIDAQVEMVKKWDGKAPQVVTNDSMFAAMFSAGKLNAK